MSKLKWDQIGERLYETGVDRGVLYLISNGEYDNGVAWNGLTAVTESPGGAESNPQYADNIQYLNLISAETFGATIEAFTYPDEFAQCDGSAEPIPGLRIGQQPRKAFGFAYRTMVGNDLDGLDYGYKLHLVYGAMAAPSEKANATVNDSPEALTFSWEVTTTPVEVGEIAGIEYKPTASLTIDSKDFPVTLAALETILYGSEGVDPRLPLPGEVYSILAGSGPTLAVPTKPTYNEATNTITIPTVTGLEYRINGEPVTGAVVIDEDTIVTVHTLPGYIFPPVTDVDWLYEF